LNPTHPISDRSDLCNHPSDVCENDELPAEMFEEEEDALECEDMLDDNDDDDIGR